MQQELNTWKVSITAWKRAGVHVDCELPVGPQHFPDWFPRLSFHQKRSSLPNPQDQPPYCPQEIVPKLWLHPITVIIGASKQDRNRMEPQLLIGPHPDTSGEKPVLSSCGLNTEQAKGRKSWAARRFQVRTCLCTCCSALLFSEPRFPPPSN